MSKEHFEPVTAKSLAKVILKTMSLGTYYEDHIEAILEPHIRKPSDEDKSVPQRCKEAYNEAVALLGLYNQKLEEDEPLQYHWKLLFDSVVKFLKKPNPFKEAEIVPDDVDVFMDLLEDEKQKWPEPNLPSDVEQFKKRLQDIMYFKNTDSDYTHTGKINSLFDDLISAVKFYKSQSAKEDSEPTKVPFSLELAAQGHKVVTRMGNNVKILADDLSGYCPIMAIINVDGKKYDKKFMINGRIHDTIDCDDDLFILKEPVNITIQLLKDNRGFIYARGGNEPIRYASVPESQELIKTITVTI